MLIEIRVRPNSSRSIVGGIAGDPPRLVVAVQAPAVEGKANEAVLKELARAFGVKRRALRIVLGEKTRDKRVNIEGDDAELLAHYDILLKGLKLF